MGAKNSRHIKEEEKKTESSPPDRGHTYDEIADEFIKNREEEEKKKQNAEIVKNALESQESNDNTSPSNSSNRARIHPYDNVVLDDDKAEEQQTSATDEVKDKDAIKVNTKAKDKKAKKEEKKEEQKKKEDKKKEKKKDEKSKDNKELPPIVVLSVAPIAPVAPVAPAVADPEDVEYTNVAAIKKAEESKENEITTEDGCVYAQPIKTKKKDKKVESKTESTIALEPQPVKQLNYIEVQIIPKSPASNKQELKSPKKHEHLTYSNIVRENGKIVLVPEQ